MAKSGKLELGDNILRTLRINEYGLSDAVTKTVARAQKSTFNQCDVIGQQSNSVKKCKIRAITSFKVMEVGIPHRAEIKL